MAVTRFERDAAAATDAGVVSGGEAQVSTKRTEQSPEIARLRTRPRLRPPRVLPGYCSTGLPASFHAVMPPSRWATSL